MDLFTFVNHGAAKSGAHHILARPNAQQRADEKRLKGALAKTRAQWLEALLVDETAAWMSTFEKRPDVLRGLTTVLSLAALAKSHDDGNLDSPTVRVIRGAVNAVEECGKAGSVLTPLTVQALSSAAKQARTVIEACTDAAIQHACVTLRAFVLGEESPGV